MITIEKNISLKPYNTLALDKYADYFCQLESEQDIVEVCNFVKEHELRFLVVGQGSNIVFLKNYTGLVAHFSSEGYELLEENEESVFISVAAGENWHRWVKTSLQQQWFGLENLALIPGSVGAAPVQNIGAYGVELQQFVHSVRVYDREDETFRDLTVEECQFSYRHSIFKQHPERYIISRVIFRLAKQANSNIGYAALQDYFTDGSESVSNPSPQAVFDAVVAIRQSKLPNPEQVPNVGSFFKNPVISQVDYQRLLTDYPQLVAYPYFGGESDEQMKLAAGWLIDQAGWKGCRRGSVGVHNKQALILCRYIDGAEGAYSADGSHFADGSHSAEGSNSGEALMALANEIVLDIQQRFNVALEVEPLLI